MLSLWLKLVTNWLLYLKLNHNSYLLSTMWQYLFPTWYVYLLLPLHLLVTRPSWFLMFCFSPEAPSNLYLPSCWPFNPFLKPILVTNLHSVLRDYSTAACYLLVVQLSILVEPRVQWEILSQNIKVAGSWRSKHKVDFWFSQVQT